MGTPSKMVARSRWIAVRTAAGREPGDQRHGAAEPHADVQDAGQAEHVEQRQDGDHDVVGLDVEQPPRDVGVHVQLDVRELGALGAARRAGGVDDHGRVHGLPHDHVETRHDDVQQPFEGERRPAVAGVADDVDPLQPGGFRALGRLSQDTCPGNQDASPAVAEVEGHFGRLEQDVQRHHDAAGLEDAEIRDEELRDVGQLQRDRVAGLYPDSRQGSREPVRSPVQFPVGDLAFGEHRHGPVRRGVRGFAEDDSKVKAHGSSPSGTELGSHLSQSSGPSGGPGYRHSARPDGTIGPRSGPCELRHPPRPCGQGAQNGGSSVKLPGPSEAHGSVSPPPALPWPPGGRPPVPPGPAGPPAPRWPPL